MGITIHYQGKIRSIDKIPELIAEMRDLAETAGWEYSIINICQKSSLRGISLDVHPQCESFSLTFAEGGGLISYFNYQDIPGRKGVKEVKPLFVKTQFAGVETHILIIRLLEYVKKKYIPDLEIDDEGEYWQRRDINLLREKFNFLNKALRKIEDLLSTEKLPADVTSNGELLDRIEEILRNGFSKK